MKALLLISTFFLQISIFAQPTLTVNEILPSVGSWVGQLSYLDYSTQKQTVITASLDIEQIRPGVFSFYHQFPKEPNVRWTDTVELSKDGKFWGKETVAGVSRLADGSIELVTEEKGKDDSKPALLRRIYTMGENIFSIKKQVLFDGAMDWITRHEYKYTTRARFLSPAQMKTDLGLLKTTWEQLHPGLYRYNSKAQIDGYFKELDEKTNSVMEQREFFILISQLNIKLHCGHSFVSYYNNKRLLKNNLYSNVFLPVLFKVVEGKFVITHNLSSNPGIRVGDMITAINGISAKKIIDSLLTVSKADGRNGLNKQLDNISFHPREIYTDRYSLFDLFFPLFFKKDLNEKTFQLQLVRTKGTKLNIQVDGLSKEARQQAYIQKYGDVPRNEKSWYLKSIDQNTIVFRLGDFTTFNWKFDFNKYLDSVFTQINKIGYKNLIVDIRENEGGADEARDAVLSYLTSKNIGCANPYRRLYRYNAVPDSLNKYLSTWDDDFRKPKPDSLYKRTADGFYENRFPDNCVEISPKPNHFKGQIYLITDVTNSSATFIMADVFKSNKLGTIVGETTGGSQQGINGGELFFFYLPNSKIEMDLPLIYQAPKSTRPDEGIKPDFEIKSTVKDVVKKRDPQMEYILKNLIGRSK